MTDLSNERPADARKGDRPAQVEPDVVTASETTPENIPVMRPQLPRAETLLPYLRRIDASRIYSNYGPLVQQFENRLSRHFELPAGGAVSASTGTTALIGAVLATAGRARPDRPLGLIPAFTFVATAVAMEQFGYTPYLTHQYTGTLGLDPERLLADVGLDRVGVVVPVAPFGRAVPQAPWRAFRDRTGIPVVIDVAASF